MIGGVSVVYGGVSAIHHGKIATGRALSSFSGCLRGVCRLSLKSLTGCPFTSKMVYGGVWIFNCLRYARARPYLSEVRNRCTIYTTWAEDTELERVMAWCISPNRIHHGYTTVHHHHGPKGKHHG